MAPEYVDSPEGLYYDPYETGEYIDNNPVVVVNPDEDDPQYDMVADYGHQAIDDEPVNNLTADSTFRI